MNDESCKWGRICILMTEGVINALLFPFSWGFLWKVERDIIGHGSQKPLEYLIVCNYSWFTIFWSKADSRNKPTSSLKVKIGHKLNYGHHIKVSNCIMLAAFGAVSSSIFPCYICLRFVLSETIAETLLLLVSSRYLIWNIKLQIFETMALCCWMKKEPARYFGIEKLEAQRSKLFTWGLISRSKPKFNSALFWTLWSVMRFIDEHDHVYVHALFSYTYFIIFILFMNYRSF